MGAIILATIVLCLSAGVASAEVVGVARPDGAAWPLAAEPSKQSVHEAAVADCEGMWDRGTHMTKKEWSHTCRRVQNRLRQIEVR